jgi:hypothetical protein
MFHHKDSLSVVTSQKVTKEGFVAKKIGQNSGKPESNPTNCKTVSIAQDFVTLTYSKRPKFQ